MEKFRIKQIGIRFIPQVKKSLFWKNITLPESIYLSSIDDVQSVKPDWFFRCHESIKDSYNLIYINNAEQICSSLHYAEEIVSIYKRLMKPVKYRGHKIIQTRDRFVDLSTNRFFEPYGRKEPLYANHSASLEGVKKVIDEFEDYWKHSKVRKNYYL